VRSNSPGQSGWCMQRQHQTQRQLGGSTAAAASALGPASMRGLHSEVHPARPTTCLYC
jgi:hypothetical protein